MRKSISAVLLCSVLSMLLLACGTEGEEAAAKERDQGGVSLPKEVPSGFPFPAGADLKVQSTGISGGTQHTVSFSFAEDAATTYEEFKTFSQANGYTIATESEENLRFSAVNDASEAISVNLSDMGSVSTGTVTFSSL